MMRYLSRWFSGGLYRSDAEGIAIGICRIGHRDEGGKPCGLWARAAGRGVFFGVWRTP